MKLDGTMASWLMPKIDLFKGELEQHIARHSFSDSWANVDKQAFGSTVWRVSNFGALHWPDEEYGHFYSEDVYLILSVRGSEDTQSSVIRFRYDVHVWVGKHAQPGDYLTAMFKMCELDNIVNHQAALHREVEGHESGLFKSYFNPLTILTGSSKESYRNSLLSRRPFSARLFIFYKPDPFRNSIRVREVPANQGQLDNSFVFVLDVGHTIFQYNGTLCKHEDAVKAMRYIQTQKANRGGLTKVEMLNESDDEDSPKMKGFMTYISRGSVILPEVGTTAEELAPVSAYPSLSRGAGIKDRSLLIRVQNKKGKLTYMKVKEGKMQMKDFEKLGFALFDTGKLLFVWVGKKSNNEDRYFALEYAHEYLVSTDHPLSTISVLREGQPSPMFQRAMAGTFE